MKNKGIHKFLPKWLWDLIMDKECTYHKMIFGVRTFLRNLGLTNANEPTWVALAATLILGKALGLTALPDINAHTTIITTTVTTTINCLCCVLCIVLFVLCVVCCVVLCYVVCCVWA